MGIDREPGKILKFPKVSPRTPDTLGQLNEIAAKDHVDATDEALSAGRPVEIEKEKLSSTEIAERILNEVGLKAMAGKARDVTEGAAYRVPNNRDELDALLQDFIALPNRYGRRYQYLVAKAYLGKEY